MSECGNELDIGSGPCSAVISKDVKSAVMGCMMNGVVGGVNGVRSRLRMNVREKRKVATIIMSTTTVQSENGRRCRVSQTSVVNQKGLLTDSSVGQHRPESQATFRGRVDAWVDLFSS